MKKDCKAKKCFAVFFCGQKAAVCGHFGTQQEIELG